VATISGVIVTKTGRYREQIWTAWFFMVLSSGLMILLDDRSSGYDDSFRFDFACVLNGFPSLVLNRLYSCCLVHLGLVLFSRRACSHRVFGCVLTSNPQVPLIALQAAMPLKDMALSTGAFIFLRWVQVVDQQCVVLSWIPGFSAVRSGLRSPRRLYPR